MLKKNNSQVLKTTLIRELEILKKLDIIIDTNVPSNKIAGSEGESKSNNDNINYKFESIVLFEPHSILRHVVKQTFGQNNNIIYIFLLYT